ncbi:hypothetical protein BDA96_03G216600 [Sorghum bicolor]|uniref:Uncharacterized protein n=1 Tax=Sorghum bicolor TaxID=4558 RepID=A0A921RFC8_SORBI|nr:hypothetical protein BDA96_03G216600 [Sorghum bicolor]
MEELIFVNQPWPLNVPLTNTIFSVSLFRCTLTMASELLLATQFFTICTTHFLATRNECNLFFTQCEAPPRSIYVVHIEDILDISDVQTYIISSARVVFLNKRPKHYSCGISVTQRNKRGYGYASHGGNNVGSSNACIKDSCNHNNEEPSPKRIAHHQCKGIPQRAPFF